jgi:adenosylcobyric acid synthase
VIVHGRIWGKLSASEYHQHRVHDLLPLGEESYKTLAQENDLIVLEGAGSPAEINLKKNDIVNMRMADMADAACLLVGDIDRGGVFASLLGTLELLDSNERVRIKGFVINKFRGDIKLLLPGIRTIEERLGIGCLGVVPYLSDLKLEEEDSVGLEWRTFVSWSTDSHPERQLRIAVVCFPSLSNFTDFDSLEAEPEVQLRFCRSAEELRQADIVILPGSKQTVADLHWLRRNGFAEAIQLHRQEEKLTVGICGGMQMLGEDIFDPEGVENLGKETGLGVLPIRTTMLTEKVTVEATGELLNQNLFGRQVLSTTVRGYEIHVGETSYLPGAQALARLERAGLSTQEILDGAVSFDGRSFGTYLHGIFDDDVFRHQFLSAARSALGLAPGARFFDWKLERQRQWKQLSTVVEQALDLDSICSWLELSSPAKHKQVCDRKY